jgi:hypothetical protein
MQSSCQRLVHTDLQEELVIAPKQECHTRALRKHWHVFLTAGRETWRRPRVVREGYLVVFVLLNLRDEERIRNVARRVGLAVAAGNAITVGKVVVD